MVVPQELVLEKVAEGCRDPMEAALAAGMATAVDVVKQCKLNA
jgi:hypothetical protein